MGLFNRRRTTSTCRLLASSPKSNRLLRLVPFLLLLQEGWKQAGVLRLSLVVWEDGIIQCLVMKFQLVISTKTADVIW